MANSWNCRIPELPHRAALPKLLPDTDYGRDQQETHIRVQEVFFHLPVAVFYYAQ